MDVVEIPDLFENKVRRRIVFDINGLTIKDAAGFAPDVFIPADKIAAFRLGYSHVNIYVFLGLNFFIDIKNYENKVHRLSFFSPYYIKKKIYNEKWNELRNLFYKYYLNSLVDYYIELLNIGQPFELAGVSFNNKGIKWNKCDIMKFEDIKIANYMSYFVVYNSHNNKEQKTCRFETEWNAIVLQTILKSIVEHYRTS
ncbi:MAG: hypothetical protein EOP47_26310 [Sphingobacteriaceae bacterium]|nr:MAG: hypothetical protein EOP47_26310 [Sphingobacteriaceae bacterium]